MATRRAELVTRNYRTRLKAIRAETMRRLEAAYRATVREAEAGRRETVAITPEMAAEWLKHSAVDQPPINQAEVARISAQIEAGDWQPDAADPIQLAPGDKLLNGQHRLAAIVAAGVTVRAPVAFDVPPHAIASSYAAFAPVAARMISAAQGAMQTTTRAYIRGTSGEDPLPVPNLAGTARAGHFGDVPLGSSDNKGGTMTEAVAGILPLIFGAIANGGTASEAVDVTGAYFVDRLADNELTRVVDAEIEGQKARATGWVGITAAPSDACVGNAGFHTFDEEIYRHPGCSCEREVVYGDAT